MSWLALLASVQALLASWWKAGLGAAVVAAPLFLLGHCAGERSARAVQAGAVTEIVRTDSVAKEVAAGERLADAASVAQRERNMKDAVQNLPDARPGARLRALDCERLRNQGTDVSRVPECRRPEG